MSKALARFFIITSVLILSCTKDEDATPGYDFSVTVKPGYFSSNVDMWIILHDKTGKVISEGQLSEGHTSKFTVAEKNIGVTLISIGTNTLNGLPYFNMESFLNVNAATTWTLKLDSYPASNCGGMLGNVEILVSDPNINTSMSGNLSDMLPDQTSSTSSSMHFSPTTVYANCNNLFLYVMDKNRIPHYKFLENINPGKYVYNLSQLSTFDQVVEISYKETYTPILIVRGFAANQSIYDKGYTTNMNFGEYMTNVNSFSIKAGYLNRFPKNLTGFYVSYPGYAMSYEEAGGVPSAINLPETLTANISDKTITGYTFSVSEPIVFRQIEFDYHPSLNEGKSAINWIINAGPSSDFKNLTAASSQFSAKYPQFKMENLPYRRSTFYTQRQTLDEEVSQRFGDVVRPEIYKSISKSFY